MGIILSVFLPIIAFVLLPPFSLPSGVYGITTYFVALPFVF